MNTAQLLICGKKEIKVPSKLDQKWPNNLHGLFNQLFQVVNNIASNYFDATPWGIAHWLNDKDSNTYIDVMSIDPFEGSVISISDVLNLEKMNLNYGYNFKDITILDNFNFTGGWVFNSPFEIYYKHLDLFIESCKKLIFAENINFATLEMINKKGLSDRECNLVHLRFCSNFNKKQNDAEKKGQLTDFFQEGDIYEGIKKECREMINKTCSRDIPLCIIAIDKDHEFIKELSKDYELIFVRNEEYDEFIAPRFRGYDIYGLYDVVFASHLKIKNFIHQAELGKPSSSYSIFLKYYLNYQKDYYYYLPNL